MAADDSVVSDYLAGTRQSKITLEMRLLWRRGRQAFHSFCDFNQAFLTFPLLAT
jgi:hypothetical protein